MNRIVQRNGAAPPWVEVQGGEYHNRSLHMAIIQPIITELDTAIQTFREILQQSWVRRAVRLLTMSNPPALLHTISLQDIKSLRDPAWVERERKYHETAIEEVNSLVRKYNGLAPYSVRRPYYDRSVEIDRLYDGCAEDISRELADRARGAKLLLNSGARPGLQTKTLSSGHDGGILGGLSGAWCIRDLLRVWLDRLVTKLRLW